MPQNQVGPLAKEIAQAHIDGNISITKTGPSGLQLTFHALDSGMCEKYARMCCALVSGDSFPEWAQDTAQDTEDKLAEMGFEVQAADGGEIGDLYYWHSGSVGHVTIKVGNGLFAEDTSDPDRGNPLGAGIKLTPYAQVAAKHPDGFRVFRPLG
jgi:hypothetical protein